MTFGVSTLLFLLYQAVLVDAQVTNDGCWRRVAECRLSCVRPTQTITVEERECLARCRADPSCEGIVYNRYASRTRRCELYDRVPIDGNENVQGPRNRPPNRGGKRRPPSPYTSGWGGARLPQPSGGRPRTPSVPWYQRAPGGRWARDTAAQPRSYQQRYGGYYNRYNQDSSEEDEEEYHPRGPGYYGSKEQRRRPGKCITNQRGSTIYQWTGRCPRGGTTPFPTIPTTLRTTPVTPPGPLTFQCPAGQIPKFLRLPQYKHTGSPVVTITGSSEDCLRACADNRANGNFVPCQSSNYNPNTGECQLFSTAIRYELPNSGGEPANGITYYEKICVPGTTTVAGCTPFVNTSPQQILIGYAAQVVSRNTYGECIQTCYESQQLFGITCASGQYFFDTKDCIINSVKAVDHPDLMVEETEYRENYFEIECPEGFATSLILDRKAPAPSVLKVGSSEWGPWTPCAIKPAGENTKVRFRNCKRHVPSTCERETTKC